MDSIPADDGRPVLPSPFEHDTFEPGSAPLSELGVCRTSDAMDAVIDETSA